MYVSIRFVTVWSVLCECKLWTMMKRAYFMTVIDGVFCIRCGCDKQIQGVFQSSCLTGVRLWAVITLQTVCWVIAGRSRWWNSDDDRRLSHVRACEFELWVVMSCHTAAEERSVVRWWWWHGGRCFASTSDDHRHHISWCSTAHHH